MLTILEYLLLAVLIGVSLIFSRWVGQQAYAWMPPQATAEAQRVDALFSFLASVGTFVFLGVVGVIVFSLLFFRAPPKDYSEGHPMRGNWKIEVLWTVVPVGLVVWLAWQSYHIYDELKILGLSPIVHLPHLLAEPASAETTNNQSKPADEEIKVIVKQWAWSFRYANNVTSDQLHLPLNQSVRLAMHSEDVIHGFYVPEFRVKQDIIPARTITFVFTPTRAGKYQLRDSQFSGTYFALMQADVYVESPQAYQQWLNRIASDPQQTKSDRLLAEPPEPVKTLFNSGWQAVSEVSSSVQSNS